MFPVQKVQPGESISAGLLNQLGTRANDNLGMTGEGDILINRAAGQTGVSDARPAPVNDLGALVHIISSTTATGWYNGRVFWRQSWALNRGIQVDIPLEDTLPEFNDCYLINITEGETGVQTKLTLPTNVLARFVGYTREETPKAVFATREGTKNLVPFPVTITANASINAYTFAYTATAFDGTVYSQVANGFEPCNGTPGRLGITITSTGSTAAGTCVVKPIGVGAIVLLFHTNQSYLSNTASGWMMSAVNYVGPP